MIIAEILFNLFSSGYNGFLVVFIAGDKLEYYQKKQATRRSPVSWVSFNFYVLAFIQCSF